ncbi:hypothetical protein CANCADRAFT_31182 [Tortispora caseinolytica NRRL Y-17796]|uniref:Transcription factor Opi1 n=1 Tax=Tortispora caseinolytica NRRL Y-17796 TaxID=767744 RepID=A0A1E4TED9_9ASCO|nr:hypothetical protein CANCADRAFT_31182 [Tortispora caseinolytica NRRL Y-17796]
MVETDSNASYDEEMRMAAQVLGKLQNGGSKSPPSFDQDQPSVSDTNSPDIRSKIGSIPLVSTAVKAYESSKERVPGFRYGAELVEYVTRPMVAPIECFANRQLGRLETSIDSSQAAIHNVWANASGISVALSEESYRSLSYCVHVLRSANNRLLVLSKDLELQISNNSHNQNPSNPHAQAETQTQNQLSLDAIRAEIISTIKHVFVTVSTYAGNALPDSARESIRSLILSLPSRWASSATASDSTPSTPILGQSSNGRTQENGNKITDSQIIGNRVLILSREALKTVNGLITVLDNILRSAEQWFGRFNNGQVPNVTAMSASSDAMQLNGYSAPINNGINTEGDHSGSAHTNTDSTSTSVNIPGIESLTNRHPTRKESSNSPTPMEI